MKKKYTVDMHDFLYELQDNLLKFSDVYRDEVLKMHNNNPEKGETRIVSYIVYTLSHSIRLALEETRENYKK